MIIDIFFLVAMAMGFWMGFSRGIIRTLFGLLALFFGLLVAMKFASTTISLLERLFASDGILITVFGFVLTFVAIMFLVRLLAKGLEKMLMKIKLNFLNKFAGGALFSMMMVVVLSILVWFADQANLIASNTKQASISYPTLIQLPAASRSLLEKVKPLFSEFWEDTEQMLEKMRNRES